MRKIEKKIVHYVYEHRPKHKYDSKTLSTRDKVEYWQDDVTYWLHGSCVFMYNRNTEETFFCCRGYNTQTTRSRLNALLKHGIIRQKKGTLFFCCGNVETEINATSKYRVTDGHIEEVKQ